MLRSFGANHLLMLGAFVVLVLDSRRFHALARLAGWGRNRHRQFRRGRGIPAGSHPDQVGLPLRQIQMRTTVDWEDGGIGWDGPEILPVEESEDPPPLDPPEEAEPNPFLPVLWAPLPALLAG